MTDQGIKSRPIYATLHRDSSGRRHLYVSAGSGPPPDALAQDDLESWTVAPTTCEGTLPRPEGAGERRFRSTRHLMETLGRRLAGERMGLRLYVEGPEDFLWDVYGVAQAHGLGRQEIFLKQSGTLARRVQCVHCKTFNEGVTTTIVRCAGCGANLFVRDHFSRRLSAFQGVKIDAEQPGDVPKAERAYP
ncbi:dimethylamine monooxygenase subunit DmmA family protein [Methylorubrum zatmanii]